MSGTQRAKPRLVGVNHIALEVGDIDAALEFYGRIFSFTLRGRDAGNAFIDMGDQFIALRATSEPHQDAHRHVGIVVDDREGIAALIEAAGGRMVEGPFLDFLDPWGNRLEVVDYRDIQFTKAPQVLRGMGLSLEKRPKAVEEVRGKGMAGED
jgi:predicted enzyme related to lactoylglutathione lyase